MDTRTIVNSPDSYVRWKRLQAHTALTLDDRMRWWESFTAAPVPKPTAALSLVAMLFAVKSNNGGYCWAYRSELSKWSRLSQKTVDRSVRALVDAGWLVRVTGAERALYLPPVYVDELNGPDPQITAAMFKLNFPNPDAYEPHKT